MALTSDQIGGLILKLQNALGAGIASIEYDGMKKSYNSPAEIKGAIAYFESLRVKLTNRPQSASVQIVMTRG